VIDVTRPESEAEGDSLERFVRKEPLRRVHEVFGVLALESEPVAPRL
jgi:protein phosphatase